MSDNIFAEIYNRILSLFGQNVKDESKNTAVNRLRLVLMQDRTNLTPEIMNRMRTELIAVLSKYVELDKEALDLNIGQEGEQMALMLSIPVIRAKDESEIEAAIKEEEESKKAKSDEDAEESEDEVSEDEVSEDKSDDNVSEDDEDSEKEKEGSEEVSQDESSDIPEEENSDSPTQKPEESSIDEQVQKQKSIPKIEKTKKEKEEE